MKRREFIAGIGGAATSYLWPRAARAQQPQKHRVAFVHSGIPADQLTETAGPFWVRRFYETLRGLGHSEGGNWSSSAIPPRGITSAMPIWRGRS